MKTAAVSKHDIWSWQGQAEQEMSPPAGSATSMSDRLQGSGKCGKTGTDVFGASEWLSSYAALNRIKDLLGPSTRLPAGAPNGEDGPGLGARLLQQPGVPASEVSAHDGGSLCLCLSKASVLWATCRDPTAPGCPPSTGVSPLPGWQLGTASSSGQEQPPGPRVAAGQPFTASGSGYQLCPSPGHSRRQDPALLLPGLLAERQELITLQVRPAPHLIAPLARRKINSTFYTLVASVLKFWHICEVLKKKK